MMAKQGLIAVPAINLIISVLVFYYAIYIALSLINIIVKQSHKNLIAKLMY
jgi:hypothetical protein